MNLFLLRHGIAAEPGAPGIKRDADRPLTEEGIEKMRQIGNAMKKLEISFELILSSPYARARKTAEIAAGALGFKEKIEFTDHLIPSADPESLIEEIQDNYGEIEDVLLVGHEPFMSTFIGTLIAGAAPADVIMKKGGLCKLSVSNLRFKKCATLEWLLTPKQMIKISNS